MKLFALLLSLALLLCACKPQEPAQTDPTQNTTAPSESVSATKTQDPTEDPTEAATETATEAATEAMSPLLLPDAWLATDAAPLSYDEYFSVDRAYSSGKSSWLRQTDEGYVLYRAKLESGKLFVWTDAANRSYLVPCEEDLSQYYLLVSDGTFAYLRGRADILKVELLTGRAHTVLRTESEYNARLQGNHVLYYSETGEDHINICRLYIPTGEKDILYTVPLEGTPESWFYFYTPESAQGDIVWRMMNPEMLALLKQEFSNPDSKYRSDYPEFWEDPARLYGSIGASIARICVAIQDETGIRAFVKYTYDPTDGSLTKKTGIVDSCWYGSGWAHDHFAPEIIELPAPTLLMEGWTAITPVASRPVSPTAEEMYAEKPNSTGVYHVGLYKIDSEPGNLFALKDGIATPVWDKQVTGALDSKYYIYCLAEDNTVYQISYDGSFIQPLYTGKKALSKLSYYGGKLCLLDGTTLIEIDVPKLQYRAVLEHPQIKRMYYSQDSSVYLRIEIYAGLCEIDYHYDPATGQLTEDHPRL